MKCKTDKNNAWQNHLKEVVTDPYELFKLLELNTDLLAGASAAASDFALKVPRSLIAQMKKGDLNDPILRQVLPLGVELDEHPEYVKDPLAEQKVNPIPGLLHKYRSRVLLTLTGSCAIHCRYCFRRHFPYEDNNPGKDGWLKAIEYIQEDSSISEVILSGGDPLIASDRTLKTITQLLAGIAHVKRLRIHSRMPIVSPERVTADCIDAVCSDRLKTIVVVHCNHPNEIQNSVRLAMRQLAARGIVLLNQSVLLKGINDDVDTLVLLSETLFDAGILPYYLYVLDKVQGAAHFDLPREVANKLHQALMGRLSGYLVPKLVCEQPGALSKLPINPPFFCTE